MAVVSAFRTEVYDEGDTYWRRYAEIKTDTDRFERMPWRDEMEIKLLQYYLQKLFQNILR